MKIALTIIRSIGILGAIWILYMEFYAYSSMVQQTQDILPGSLASTHPLTLHIWQSTIPFCLLALLIVVPYKRIKKIYSFVGAFFIGALSIYFLSFLFGQYFLAARFVPSSIPSGIWISAGIFVVFFVSQIAAIAIQNKTVEQCDPPNGYPRHASC
jgi:hypothetical protein